jgi:acetyl-CoA C-acetyltransferase
MTTGQMKEGKGLPMSDARTPLDSTPVLVGADQFTYRGEPVGAPTALQMIEGVARGALADTGAGEAVRAAVDTVAVVSSTVYDTYFTRLGVSRLANPPRALGRALGITPAREIFTAIGGNTPQMVVNRMAEEIARGEVGVAVISGAEFLGSFIKLLQMGADLTAWGGDDDPPTEIWGDDRDGASAQERRHSMQYPANTYPMIETAIRAARGRTVADHTQALGRLMAPLTRVAAENPHAWFPVARSAEEIATETSSNRMIATPYTKYMNAIIQVDMAAALVMTSVGKAKELGIPREKWVFLHGCAEGHDIWNVSEREALHRSPAINAIARRAFGMADWRVDDVDFIDLYSCFPSALEIACAEIGIAEDDPRGLTVTGGLPYFGGPGNNYVTHAIATMMEKLRAKPGAKGLVTANGWFITKHAMGLYSTEPVMGPWRREDPKILQAELDRAPTVVVAETPSGPGRVETGTVVYSREGVRFAILLGRLDNGERFIAHVTDGAILEKMKAMDVVGLRGSVSPGGESEPNLFTPEAV